MVIFGILFVFVFVYLYVLVLVYKSKYICSLSIHKLVNYICYLGLVTISNETKYKILKTIWDITIRMCRVFFLLLYVQNQIQSQKETFLWHSSDAARPQSLPTGLIHISGYKVYLVFWIWGFFLKYIISSVVLLFYFFFIFYLMKCFI